MKKPYVVTVTVTYTNRIIVNAESSDDAEEYAAYLYEENLYDPERNGYDGCTLDVTDANDDDIAIHKFDTYTAEYGEDKDEEE